MHRTHLPLRTWVLAMYLIASSSKGVSAMTLKGWLGVTYKTAWFVGHRVRAMMAAGALGAAVRATSTRGRATPRGFGSTSTLRSRGTRP